MERGGGEGDARDPQIPEPRSNPQHLVQLEQEWRCLEGQMFHVRWNHSGTEKEKEKEKKKKKEKE